MAINGGLVAIASNYLGNVTSWDQVWVFAVAKVFATTGALFFTYTLMRRWVFVAAR